MAGDGAVTAIMPASSGLAEVAPVGLPHAARHSKRCTASTLNAGRRGNAQLFLPRLKKNVCVPSKKAKLDIIYLEEGFLGEVCW